MGSIHTLMGTFELDSKREMELKIEIQESVSGSSCCQMVEIEVGRGVDEGVFGGDASIAFNQAVDSGKCGNMSCRKAPQISVLFEILAINTRKERLRRRQA